MLFRSWYKTLRLISVVGLMSVLIYLGIRIMISATAGDKAKYKERLKDWIVAMCLVFFIHYIMVFIMTAVDQITWTIAGTDSVYTNTGYVTPIKTIGITIYDGNDDTSAIDMQFSTNLTGYMRLLCENPQLIKKLAAGVMYCCLTFYTVYFTIKYLTRLLRLTFLTLIAPLVALTYPIDKVRDGKAQAFNYWFREYMMNALLPVIHIILYTIFVTSAEELATSSPLYAICALAFIVPAEKIVREMFGFKSSLAPAAGGFAGGAMATQLANMWAKRGARGNEKKDNGGGKTKIPTYGNAGQINSGFDDLAIGSGAVGGAGGSQIRRACRRW